MRRRTFPNFIGEVYELEERQHRLESIMRIIGFSPEKPNTLTVADGTRNRVLIGKINGDYGIKILDNSGSEILLANGTIVADAIKAGTLDCNAITVSNLSANDIVTGSLKADFIQGGTLDCSTMTVQNLDAGSITVGTFVSINDRLNATSIHGDKIQVGTLDADRIEARTIDAGKITSRTITANEIALDTITADEINADSIETQHLQANSITTTKINGLAITNSKIADNTIQSAKINYISADKITAGQLTVGSGSIDAIYIDDDGTFLNSAISWAGNTAIWEDSLNRMGINSGEPPLIMYVDGSEEVLIYKNGQAVFQNGVSCRGNFNVTDNYAAHFTGEVRLDTNYIRLSHSSDAKLLTLNDLGVTFYEGAAGRGGLSWGNGADLKVDQTGKWFQINGNAKEAIVPTRDGYRSLYCTESPGVWFMDFVEGETLEKAKENVDSKFMEVTEKPYRWIKAEEGFYQVWGKRKGHADKRFEKRSEKEFKQNERFLTLRKRM